MSIVYKILESHKNVGVFTIRIEDGKCAFNHSFIHTKDEFEDFEVDDVGIENLNGIQVYHINGHIITYKEFKFITKVLEDEL